MGERETAKVFQVIHIDSAYSKIVEKWKPIDQSDLSVGGISSVLARLPQYVARHEGNRNNILPATTRVFSLTILPSTWHEFPCVRARKPKTR